MNAEKVLTWSAAALGHLDGSCYFNAIEILEGMKAEAEAEIRRDAAKQSGNATRQKAAERVIKNAKKSRYPERLGGAWITPDGMQNICDGVQAYRLREALPLEELPKDVDKVNIERIVLTNCGDVVPLPDLPEIRAYIKTEKARIKAIKKERDLTKDKSVPLWDFGENLPRVNAEYLLTALELLPNCTAYARRKNEYLYLESEAGAGVILPVRKD